MDEPAFLGDNRPVPAIDVSSVHGHMVADGRKPGIPDVFRQRAAEAPQRPAVRSLGGDVTFGQLDGVSDAIATAIVDRTGQGPTPIALLLDHDWPAVAACLGVLKAGDFYVCLRAQDPVERLRDIVADAGPALLICSAATRAVAEATCPDMPRLLLREAMATKAVDANRLPPPDERSLVAFTSGSTGRPKGVLQAQASSVHWARMVRLAHGVHPGDTQSLFTPLSFAASNLLYGALLNGATVCMYSAPELGPTGVAAWLDSSGVTILETSVGLYRAVLRLLGPGTRLPETVRTVLTGLEPLTRDDVIRHRAHTAPDCALVNVLGSTECYVITRTEIPLQGPVPDGVLTAGTPYPGIDVQIMDEQGQSVPAGTAGEVIVRSPLLALGYWNNAALTAERFRRDADGVRFVRTGDLARLRPDGGIELLGRIDHRARVRGHSVFLGEVERALLALPEVHEATVASSPAPDGGDRLTAYIVPSADTPPTVRQLRLALAERLPSHMIPAAFRLLPQLPRSERSKVDKQALDAGVPAPLSSTYVGPRSTLEQDLCALWAGLLGVDRVGRDDDFFELGGDSLLAAEMAAAVQEQLRLDLPLGRLAERPTVATCARILTYDPSTVTDRGVLVPVQPQGERPALFCLGGGGGTALAWHALSQHLGVEQPLYVAESKGLHTRGIPDRRVPAVARTALAAIRRVQPHGPYHLAGYSFGALVAFELARQIHAAGEEITGLVIFDFPAPGMSHANAPRAGEQDSDTPPPVDRRGGGLHSLPPARVVRAVWRRLRRVYFNATVGLVRYSPRLQYTQFDMISYRAAQRYRPTPAPVPVRRVLVVRAEDGMGGTAPADMGWSRWLKGELRSILVGGDHWAVLRQPEPALLQALAEEGLGGQPSADREVAAARDPSSAGDRAGNVINYL